ncbi:MAG TPA: VOC family protein [Dongiaceae bacterium]|nr:VOC family protein [Dongiaceae bacterium]
MGLQRRQLLQLLSYAVGSGFFLSRDESALAAQAPANPASAAPPAQQMERVVGVGGFFFRAHDPAALLEWYAQHLGIGIDKSSGGAPLWPQEAGPASFTPLPETTKYFGDPGKSWMMNFRVRDLDKMVAQLQAAGIAVKVDPQAYPYGRFARLHDPEGNPIELWQPS